MLICSFKFWHALCKYLTICWKIKIKKLKWDKFNQISETGVVGTALLSYFLGVTYVLGCAVIGLDRCNICFGLCGD
jgi:hypothetical protein